MTTEYYLRYVDTHGLILEKLERVLSDPNASPGHFRFAQVFRDFESQKVYRTYQNEILHLSTSDQKTDGAKEPPKDMTIEDKRRNNLSSSQDSDSPSRRQVGQVSKPQLSTVFNCSICLKAFNDSFIFLLDYLTGNIPFIFVQSHH